jgi:cytochrome c oxidase subunit I+III
MSHSWWATVIVLLVAGSLYLAYVFSYLYLWTVSPQVWPKAGALPDPSWPFASAALLLVSAVAIILASRVLRSKSFSRAGFAVLVAGGIALLVTALVLEIWGHWSDGLRPKVDAHAAMVAMASFLQAQLVIPAIVFSGFVLVRLALNRIDTRRRAMVDNLMLLWLYAAGQGLVGLILVHGFPRVVP